MPEALVLPEELMPEVSAVQPRSAAKQADSLVLSALFSASILLNSPHYLHASSTNSSCPSTAAERIITPNVQSQLYRCGQSGQQFSAI